MSARELKTVTRLSFPAASRHDPDPGPKASSLPGHQSGRERNDRISPSEDRSEKSHSTSFLGRDEDKYGIKEETESLRDLTGIRKRKKAFKTTDDPGYESPTGERIIPSLKNFENMEPVPNLAHKGERAFNREGRAICRRLLDYEWSAADIALVFSASLNTIYRISSNSLSTPDDIRMDDSHIAERAFKMRFPALKESGTSDFEILEYLTFSQHRLAGVKPVLHRIQQRNKTRSRLDQSSSSISKRRMRREADSSDEEEEPIRPMPKPNADTTSSLARKRYPPQRSHPSAKRSRETSPNRSKKDPLAVFLDKAPGMDSGTDLDALQSAGLSLDMLKALADGYSNNELLQIFVDAMGKSAYGNSMVLSPIKLAALKHAVAKLRTDK
ncbi:unnamed protein product [Mycena citricolor]|uniref:Uncharacterized protein n=1 Tax=Mycena citricolor TaxID=2018698 RepID=A0AAD2H274_9AGAR|nr:unnamed protein product [Mycena citricolor]